MTTTRQAHTDDYYPYPNLAALLNIARDRRGMTKTAAYLELGTTAMTYRQWINGQRGNQNAQCETVQRMGR